MFSMYILQTFLFYLAEIKRFWFFCLCVRFCFVLSSLLLLWCSLWVRVGVSSTFYCILSFGCLAPECVYRLLYCAHTHNVSLNVQMFAKNLPYSIWYIPTDVTSCNRWGFCLRPGYLRSNTMNMDSCSRISVYQVYSILEQVPDSNLFIIYQSYLLHPGS